MSRTRFSATTNLLPLLLVGLSVPLAAQVPPTLILPPGALNQSTTPGVTVTLSPNYSDTVIQFFATFSAVPNGYSISNGTYLGWCADAFGNFVANPNYTLISTYDNATLNNPPGGGRAQNPNWNKVNWVLNNKPTNGTANSWIVQQTIWKLLTGQYITNVPGVGNYPAPAPAPDAFSPADTAIATALYTAANAQGSFVPGPGQVTGVMLYIDGINPDGTTQESIATVAGNNINPFAPPLNGLNGQPNLLQEILVEVPVGGTGNIGDFVWQDTNQNGIQDAGEPGINGVTVKLCADSSCTTVLATTVTGTFKGNNGFYQFADIPLGTYWVSIDTTQPMLAGLVPTLTGQGTPATDSNINPSMVTLTVVSPNDETIDFGFTSPGTSAIGDFVWQDNNANGLQDAGEPGLPGLTVNLCSDSACANILKTTVTDQNGAYHFTGLFEGIYYVQVIPGAGFVATIPQAGFPANASIDSGGNVAGVPNEVNLPINTVDNTIDFGFVPPAQGAIGDFVWHDLNRNGIQDAGEPGINNVTVRLFDASNNLLSTTTTVTHNGQDGYYQFTGLAAGTYTVVVDTTTIPPGYTATTTNAPGATMANDSNGSPATVTLATNLSTDETIDFGYVSPCAGVIGDFVWNDLNNNGIQDAGEPGIPNVIVNLYDSNHVFLFSTTTDSNGAYHFNGRCAATYTVEVVPPANFVPSPSMAGGNPATDSNGSPATVTLGIDQTDDTIDFGYYMPVGSIAGTVYTDSNKNGLLDNGEPGIAGVTVTLTDCSNNPVATTTTGAGGTYLFSNLPAGCYQVSSPATASGESLETSSPLTVNLTAGQNSTGNNFGYILGSIAGTVYTDSNKNSLLDSGEPGIGGVIVTLSDCSNNQISVTLTANDGTYLFGNLAAGCYKVSSPATASGENLETSSPLTVNLAAGQNSVGNNFGYILGSIAGTVYTDSNKNSVFDSGEPGIAGVTVTLTDCSNNPVATTTTGADGSYTFNNLAAGCYKVSSPATANGENLETSSPLTVNLAPGQNSTGNNFGYILGSIAGTVYTDSNKNSVFDAGEPGIAGVTVTLIDCSNNPVATTTTGTGGTYLFSNLAAGCYKVSSPATANGENLETSSPLTVNLAAGQNSVGNNFGYILGSIAGTVYTDSNKNSVFDSGEPGIAGVTVTLTDCSNNPVATTTTGADGSYTFNNLAAGCYKVSSPATTNGESLETSSPLTVNLTAGQNSTGNNFGYILGSIAGTVYTDSNKNSVFDAGEPGIAGVTVTLTDCSNNPVATTTTGAGGTYLFSNLAAGCYKVSSPATANGENLETSSPLTVNLTAGQNSTGNNFGYILGSIAGTVYTDSNKNSVFDAGEPGIAGVTVTLTDCSNNPVATTTTGAGGTYLFSNLAAGCYKVSSPATANNENLETASPLTVNLTAGQNSTGNNFGYILGSIAGTVYTDSNKNSVLDAGEPGIAGVTVTLTDCSNNPVATTTTGAGGTYLFSNLAAGCYKVSSPATANSENLETASPLTVNLTAGQNSTGNNFGYILGSIAGTVYTDSNKNSVLDSGEPGIAGVTVTLTDCSNNPVATTTTGAGGTYLFSNLAAGCYKVSSPATANNENLETASPLTVNLTAGQNSTGNNFGYILGSIAGTVYTDSNKNSVLDSGEPGIAGVTVTLTDCSNNPVATTTTGAGGTYLFSNLAAGCYKVSSPATANSENLETASPLTVNLTAGQNSTGNNFGYILGSIAGTVYTDSNKNSILDSGEPGIAGVTVTLTDCSNNPVATTTTGAGGTYLFSNLAAGCYKVSSPATANSENLETASPLTVNLTAGQNSTGNNFGYILGSIAGTVYTDSNKNSVLDSGEPGIAGVTVTLTDCSNNPAATTTTGAGGTYLFSNLAAGCYKVSSPATANNENLETASPLTVNLASGQNSTGNNFGYILGSIAGTVYTDTNKNGVLDSGEPGIAGVTVTLTDCSNNPIATTTTGTGGTYLFSNLAAGCYKVSSPATANNENLETASPLTVNLASGQNSTGNNFGYILGSIAGTVYTDTNKNGVLDSGEPGIAGVTVTLTDCSNNPIATTTTGTGGTYLFSNLAAGCYKVSSPATANSENLETASPLTVNLTAGQNSTGNNFGYILGSIAGTVYTDSNKNSILDSGEPGIAGVTVTLTDCSNNPIATTTTGTGGTYLFSNLPAGCYKVSSPATANSETLETASPLTVNLTAGQNSTGNNFGYILITPLTLACASNKGQVGVLYNSSVVVTGGVAPFTFTVATGALPAGLTLNASTGAITGTPTSAGTFNFTIKVTDHTGATATSSCTSSCNAPITWNFNSPVGALGTSQTYNAGGIAITAYGYSTSGASFALYGKNDGGDESGLGLSGLSDNEIDTTHFVQLDMSKAIAANATNPLILINSVQSGEGYKIYGSNTLGALGTLLASGSTDDTAFAMPGYPTYKYIAVIASSGNVLIGSVTVTLPTGACAIVVAPPIDLTCGSCGGSKGTVGTAYTSQYAVTSGTPGYTFTLISGSLPPGLSLNSSTGVISGMPTTPGTYTFTTKVVDANGATDTATCTIVVVGVPINLDCGTCGANKAYVGHSYNVSYSISGGSGTGLTYSIISGSLPPGLTLNAATGAITGTPTTAGTYTFTGKVVDSQGNTDTQICTVYVLASPIDLECGSCGSNSTSIGASYSATLSVNGGTGPFTYSIVSGSLPPGLTLNTTTGKISGTPTTSGTYTFTSKVVDANGYSDTTTCTIIVQPPPINLDCGACGTSSIKVGTPYSATLSLTGGKAPFTYSIVSGSLPPGLTLNTSTGVVSGTPTTPGSYTFTSKVVDANGSNDTATCTIVVTGTALNLDCGTCGASKATVGVAYSAQYTVAGGYPSFTYSIVSGTLPPGLKLNASTGVISGTPTSAGTYTFTAKVVDSKGNSDTQSCTVVVVTAPIDLECGSCGSANGAIGSSYSSQLAVTGGSGSGYVYSMLSGSLPPGLSLNSSTGVISGSPTTAGTYTFTSKVVDSKGNSDTTTCTIIIVNPALDLECGSCGGGKATVGTAYTSQLAVTGGNGPFTYSLSSGSLPPGLSLNTSTGVISGTPTTAGSYTFTSKVVDSKGKSDTATCTIVVVAPPVNLSCGTCSSSKANIGSSYSATMSATGGTGKYTYSIVSGSLPPGLTLNASTGVISGTPTTAGTYSFTSKVVDSSGNSDTSTCSIVVQGTPIDLGCGSCGSGAAYVGQPYSATMPVTGGAGGNTFSIVSGALPPGMSLNSSTGVISGTSNTKGAYTFTVKVVDSKGNSDTSTCTINVESGW